MLEPAEYDEPYTWADVEREPLAVALHGELPEGIYSAHTAYPLDTFELSEAGRKDLEAIEKIAGRAVTEVCFRAEEIEQARALGAAYGES